MKDHRYNVSLSWTGNKGAGTTGYTAYERSHTIAVNGKPQLLCSSDPSFRGDASRYNPEELFVASLSSCHMLWYLHLCSVAGIVVVEYTDDATGTMNENADGSGQFTHVTLHPKVVITDASRSEEANLLHHKANEMCFIARSCNFPVTHEPDCTAAIAI